MYVFVHVSDLHTQVVFELATSVHIEQWNVFSQQELGTFMQGMIYHKIYSLNIPRH